MSVINTSQIPPRTVELLLRVWNDEPAVIPILHRMEGLVRLEEVLEWLVRQNITGKKFIDSMREEYENSLLKMVSVILTKINKDNYIHPLIAGKDWK